MDRRTFIKNSCALCASLAGLSTLSASLVACTPLPFIELNQLHGDISVDRMLFTTEQPIVILKNKATEYDIAVVQLATDQFKAFEMQCTHQPNPLIPTKTGFQCSVHGSQFSLTGKVLQPPALRPLKEYEVRLNSDIILLKLD